MQQNRKFLRHILQSLGPDTAHVNRNFQVASELTVLLLLLLLLFSYTALADELGFDGLLNSPVAILQTADCVYPTEDQVAVCGPA